MEWAGGDRHVAVVRREQGSPPKLGPQRAERGKARGWPVWALSQQPVSCQSSTASRLRRHAAPPCCAPSTLDPAGAVKGWVGSEGSLVAGNQCPRASGVQPTPTPRWEAKLQALQQTQRQALPPSLRGVALEPAVTGTLLRLCLPCKPRGPRWRASGQSRRPSTPPGTLKPSGVCSLVVPQKVRRV